MREQAGTHWVTESVPSPISLDDERVEETCEVIFRRSPANDEYTTKRPVGSAVPNRSFYSSPGPIRSSSCYDLDSGHGARHQEFPWTVASGQSGCVCGQ
jgi:hypothetical protein